MSKNKEEIEKLLADDSFVAWIEGTATGEQTAQWDAWLADDPARELLVEEARSFHRTIAFKATQRPEIETELQRLKGTVDKYEASEKEKMKLRTFRINRKKSYSGIAAAILMLVTILGITILLESDYLGFDIAEHSSPQYITKSTQNGQQKVLTLSDGSRITLNANSSLRYPSKYSGGDLEVWLEGEAYFDIVRKTGSDARTFSVNVPRGAIEVLGTKFNVNAYDQVTEVVLEEGRVNVTMRDSLNQTEDSYVMKPGELSRISSLDDQITTHKVKADIYTAWTQNKLVFDRAPLTEIARRIEHIYDVRLKSGGHNLEEILVSGSLPNNNLKVFLNALESMLERPVTHKNGIITLGPKKRKTENE